MEKGTKEIAIRHRERQEKKKKAFAFMMSVLFLVVIILSMVLITLVTPLFNVRKVKVTGNYWVTESDVKNSLGLNEEEKIFTIDKRLFKKRVETLPYVKEAKISRALPGTVKIEVVEADVCGYIMSDKNAVLFDRDGEVINVTYEIPTKVPEILGVKVTKSVIGKKINIDYAEKFDIIVMYAAAIDKIGIQEKIDMIDVSDSASVTGIYEGRYDIFFGDSADLDYKLALMMEAILDNAENEMGTLDLRIPGKVYLNTDRTFVRPSVYAPEEEKIEESESEESEEEVSSEEESGGENV